MPAVSQAQRKWAYGVKGKAWAEAHHFNNKGKLPARAGSSAKKKRKRKAGPRRRKKGNTTTVTYGEY